MKINGASLLEAINDITNDKQIDKEIIYEGIKEGFQKAYEKFFDPEAIIDVDIDESGNITVFKQLNVVEEIEDEWLDILLSDARKKYGEEIELGQIVREEVEFGEKYSRLAIMQVGQIIKQKIREGEKIRIYNEFSKKDKEIVGGIIDDVTETSYLVNVNGMIIPIWNNKMIPNERFEIGDRISFYIEDISKDSKHSQIGATRIHAQFLARLLEVAVSEIMEGIVEIKGVAREPGKRAKVAVFSHEANVDPVGACVGFQGERIKGISSELNGERIDIIRWSENQIEFVLNTFSPVRVISIDIDDENEEINVVVPNQQLSLAIGKFGMTARITSQLLNTRVNIFSLDNAVEDEIEILWNGNITKEELESEEFLKQEFRDKKNFPARNKNNNNYKNNANLKRDEDDVIEELDLSNFTTDTSIDEIEENINKFNELAEDIEYVDDKSEVDDLIDDEYSDLYE